MESTIFIHELRCIKKNPTSERNEKVSFLMHRNDSIKIV